MVYRRKVDLKHLRPALVLEAFKRDQSLFDRIVPVATTSSSSLIREYAVLAFTATFDVFDLKNDMRKFLEWLLLKTISPETPNRFVFANAVIKMIHKSADIIDSNQASKSEISL